MFTDMHCSDWLFAKAAFLGGLSRFCSYHLLVRTFRFVCQLLIAFNLLWLFALSFVEISVLAVAYSFHFMFVQFVISEKDNLDD